ncbi:DNA/RNA non-specific endonuclease [Thalassococcus sp. S3]|uniref:DNA/RNA non-specific endonuclease n=1 Tax=Thalassococcus sp. S3 TaxID=2017482 RepID=UPI0010247C3E|nr:DNA/RNA non-specific endonuclease [Thalassococcus sp. S3]QBF33089.1 endonuclease [Thalassococcus sp. S3]
MAARKASGKSSKDKKRQEMLRDYVRARGAEYLKDPNVTSIGVGRKNGDGEVCLVFTVGQKAEPSMLESLGTQELPKEIEIEGQKILTDVVARRYRPAFDVVSPQDRSILKQRLDPVMPGASVSHINGTAGTLGLIVFDGDTGAPCILSNWHVLHGDGGRIGDTIVQPGPHDDNNVAGNRCGDLLRSHLGVAGDCALSRLRGRGIERAIHGLDVVPTRLADVDLDDHVVKTGRTTNTTHGIVRRTDVIVRLDYGGQTGPKDIGCFEIGPDPENPASDNEISMGGDSGSAWIIKDADAPTDIFAGLHFAGEGGGNADEHALACYPRSVQNKLNFTLTPPESVIFDEDVSAATGARAGFDEGFLGLPAPMPEMSLSIKRDAVNFGRAQTIPYTHFSVCLSAKRRLARFVAWNIDGARKVQLGRHGFRLDDRISPDVQLGEALYEDNRLDRGHIARRADLAWGPIEEARQANRDSFFFTNIAPQHERYNQSMRGGLWGRLENLVLEEAAQADIRVSVLAGPVFRDDDPEYRGARIPRDFWKLVAYKGADDALTAACFILSQTDLLSDIEAFDFDPFRLYQVSVEELERRTALGLAAYAEADITKDPGRLSVLSAESLASVPLAHGVREIFAETDIAI